MDPLAQRRVGRRCHRPRCFAGRDEVQVSRVRIQKGEDCRVRKRGGDEGLGIDGLDGCAKDVADVASKAVVVVRQ
jgi:hypothetical protein